MRWVVWLGLAGVLIAHAGQSLPEAPAPVPVEAFAGKTPREHSPAYTKAPEADYAFAVIDAALKRVWELPDPREPLSELIRVAAEVDPVRACDRVRDVGVRLQAMHLPPAVRVAWDSFARAVAPQDRKLRDDLLCVAVAHAGRSLADAGLWKADPVPPGTHRLDDPQRLLDFGKQTLEYRVRLWRAVLEHRTDRDSAIKLTTALFTDAKAKGLCHLGCISRGYEYGLTQDLADLDADLFFTVVRKAWDKKRVATFCGSYAYSRWQDRQKDVFTGTLAKYAVENGVSRDDVVRVFGHSDFPKAWATVTGWPDDSNTTDFPRRRSMSVLIAMWAWRDPDAALAAAEKEPGESTRRELIGVVAQVWAQKRPDQIERAVKNLDNTWQSGPRQTATFELERRKQGKPPTDTPTASWQRWHSIPPKPAGTPWTPPAHIQKFLDDPTRVAEADKSLFELAPNIGQWAPADHAVECVSRIKSPHLNANAAVWVARSLIRREEVE